MVNNFIIKKSDTLLNPQKLYGKFKEFGLYLHRIKLQKNGSECSSPGTFQISHELC